MTAGIAMGMGAMTAVMLRMPMTAVLLASLLLGSDGIVAMPLVIVAVVIAYVATAWLEPAGPPASEGHEDTQTTHPAADQNMGTHGHRAAPPPNQPLE